MGIRLEDDGGGGGVKSKFTPNERSTTNSNYRGKSNGASSTIFTTIDIPVDFTSLTRLVWKGFVTGGVLAVGQTATLTSDSAGEGQDAQASVQSDVAASMGPGAAVNEWVYVDLSSVAVGIVAGQQLGIKMVHNGIGTSLFYTGIVIEYN